MKIISKSSVRLLRDNEAYKESIGVGSICIGVDIGSIASCGMKKKVKCIV